MSQNTVSDLPPRAEWEHLPAPDRIKAIGHRAYVGGQRPETWYGIGRRQYHFLVSQGLRPDHRFLDIACGSLRLGQYLIPFLEKGHYFGLEAEPELVAAGLREELLFEVADLKAPTFQHGYDFAFDFAAGFDFAIAQSLFTHLTPEDIETCLTRLASAAKPESKVFFTFFEGTAQHPDGPSHANRGWEYTQSAMSEIARKAGWATTYIGDWGHERGQKMMQARLL